MNDWTAEEEEAFKDLERRLCRSTEETLSLVERLPVAEIYACEICGEHHVRYIARSS